VLADKRGVRRVATVVVPSLFTGSAFAVLSHFGLVGDLPLGVLLGLLVVVSISGELTGGLIRRDASSLALHAGIAAQVLGVTAIIYAIGWGPTLTVGYLFGFSRALDEAGARVWRVALGWTVAGVSCGQAALALGVVPTYVSDPYVHGIAGLGLLGTAFVMRLLGNKTEETEHTSAELEAEVRDRTRVDRELRSTLSLLTATLDSTADGILVVDHEGTITQYNARFAEMWHIPERAVANGEEELALVDAVDQLLCPEQFRAKLEELKTMPDAESHDTLEFKDGRVFERYSLPQRVDGSVVGRVWSFRDATARAQLEKELVYQAFHDALTGLANKALFHDRLEHGISRVPRSGLGLAVLFLDIDNFKTVNDTVGHAAGDELLQRVAHLVVGAARTSDTVARLGGDEFAVLMEDIADPAQAVAFAERILDVLRTPLFLEGTEVAPSVSIGVTIHEPGMTSAQLLRNADLAMYTAKDRGKNRYVKFEDAMHTASVERIALEQDLRAALTRGQLAVHFQPIVEVTGRRLIGFEALVRWQHPTRGLLLPDTFIPIAEDAGLVETIDRYVLREACRQARTWPLAADGNGYVISVNVSARRLLDPALVDDVAAAMRDLSVSSGSLVLEITESAMLRDTDTAVERLGAVRALGAKVALDDFGTGYSSLAHLRRLPIDILKIDRTFVGDLTGDVAHGGIANAILQLAQNMGLAAIAEGVETADQLDELRELGCVLAQGYYVGRPLDTTSALELVRAATPRPDPTGPRRRATVGSPSGS